jgi:hypothetical protein
MDTVAYSLTGLASLVGLICFILVIIQMFQRGATGVAILCIVLFLCCGLGWLIAFIYGWMRAREWNINGIMTVWTVALVIDILGVAVNPAPFRQAQEMFRNVGPAR